MQIRRILAAPSLTLLISLCAPPTEGRPETTADEIDLRRTTGSGLIVLPSPDPGTSPTQRRILLPEFSRFCHVAADSDGFRWIGASNRMFPWTGGSDLASIFQARDPRPPVVPAPNRRALLMLFQLAGGEFLSIMPLAGEHSVSWLETTQSGELVVDYGTLGQTPVPANSRAPLLAWGLAPDLYGAIATTWQQVIDSPPLGAHVAWRSEKDYPEPLRYLGWCTWEQYRKGINEQILLDAFDGIESSSVPVRWLLIDDGHQTERNLRMVSLRPDEAKFPRGWEPVLARRNAQRVKWVGVWHTLLMHWNGIDAQHEMPALAPHLMPHPESEETLIPKDNPEDSRLFYSKFMHQVRKQGFDFLKTDNVSRSTLEYSRAENAARAQKDNVRSLEEACREYGLGLMNCSAQNTIDLLNASFSATMRTSPDYRKGYTDTSKSQILQSVFNVCWLGQTFWPDHDMFHSSDAPVAEAMAITKAMSGGPVYLSDAPESLRHDVIEPLCYRDGLLIRPCAPAVPVPESVFSDPLYDGSPYKVLAPLGNRCCAIAVYNLSLDAASTVSGRILAEDYGHASAMIQPYEGPWKAPEEGLIVYDWHKREAAKLGAGGMDFSITDFGHRLFLLVPVTSGWAIVGRPDKYLSPATVQVSRATEREITFRMHEPARVFIYVVNGTPFSDRMSFKALAEGLFEGTPATGVASDEDITVFRRDVPGCVWSSP